MAWPIVCFRLNPFAMSLQADGEDLYPNLNLLREALAAQNLQDRTDTERIVHLIPKRSVERWILCLDGEVVDEETDYSDRREVDIRIPRAASNFFDWFRRSAGVPLHCLASLRTGIVEVRRLE